MNNILVTKTKSAWMRLLATFLLAFWLPGATLAAQEKAPDVLIKEISTEVLAVLKSEAAKADQDPARTVALLEKIVLPHFDSRRMTQLAMGKSWRQASEAQKQQLIDGFYALLVRTYSGALTQYSDQQVRFKPFKMAAGDKNVRVQTEVEQSGAPAVPVDYMLRKKDGKWQVFDIVVLGSSLVINYRTSFNQEVSARGIEGLIALLHDEKFQLEASASGGKK